MIQKLADTMPVSPENIVGKYEEKIRSTGFLLRAFIKSSLSDIIEEVDEPANMISYGYGPGYNDMICTIIPSKKGIKLGFYKGATLPDPENLLTGTGKVHRYVEIKTNEMIHSSALKALLDEALRAYQLRRKK